MDLVQEIQKRFDKLKETLETNYAEYALNSTKTHEELKGELDTQVGEIQKRLKQQEENLAEIKSKASLPGVGDGKEDFSFGRAFALQRFPELAKSKEFGFEVEVQRGMMERAANATDGSSGAYTIPIELSSKIIEPAIAQMPLYGLGIDKITGVNAGYFEVPVLDSTPEGAMTTENGSPTNMAYTFSLKRMSPHRAAGKTWISKRLLRLSAASIEPFIRNQMIRGLSLTMHKQLIQGTGVDSQVLGIENVTGLTSTISAAGQFTVKHARQMKTDLEEADEQSDGGSFGYLMRPIVLEGMVLARTTYFTGQTTGKGFQFQPVISNQDLQSRIQSKIATTTHISTTGSGANKTSTVFYGDWNAFLLALWSGLELTASDVASDGTTHGFFENMVALKADQEFDSVVTRPSALCKDTTVAADRAGMDLL